MGTERETWWETVDPGAAETLGRIWAPIGGPGFAGTNKAARQELLDARFGSDGWRIGHYVRGRILAVAHAIREYEESYRVHLRRHPEIVEFLVTWCGNVYDDNVTNVYDHDYHQPLTRLNHYQDISIRRVIAELVEDPAWPQVVATPVEEADLIDLNDGQVHRLPRAAGFRGRFLLQVRDPESPGFFLSPAVVPVHDPALIVPNPRVEHEWYLDEGCQHLSVEAFWQMSKVIEVRYDRFLALGERRRRPLDGLV